MIFNIFKENKTLKEMNRSLEHQNDVTRQFIGEELGKRDAEIRELRKENIKLKAELGLVKDGDEIPFEYDMTKVEVNHDPVTESVEVK